MMNHHTELSILRLILKQFLACIYCGRNGQTLVLKLPGGPVKD